MILHTIKWDTLYWSCMRNKEINVIKYLIEQKDWTTSNQICLALSISRRSLQNYIRNINEEHNNLSVSSREGFKLSNHEMVNKLLDQNNYQSIPQTVDERRKYIFKSLLINNTEKSLDELADELCISITTLNNELVKLKLELTKYDLVFKTKNNYAHIEGFEKNKKKLLSDLIYTDSDSFLSLDLIQAYLPIFDLKEVRKIIMDSLQQYEYFIDDFSLLNLVLHIAITMERRRIASAPVIHKQVYSKTVKINSHIIQIINNISNDINSKYHIAFTDSDQYDLSLLIMTRVFNIDPQSISTNELESIVGTDVMHLVKDIKQKTLHSFYVRLDNHDFVVRFSLHIRNLLIRLDNHIILRNPQMLNIKTTYPFIYDISVFIANIIQQSKNIHLSEDEIAYIALHIGVLIEEQKAIENKLKVVILNPTYYSNSVKILKKCFKIFQDSIIIGDMISDESELTDIHDYDLLITTIQPQNKNNKPYVLTTDFMNNKDIANIAQTIDDVLNSKKVKRLENKLKVLFKEELFSTNEMFENCNQAIEHMTNQLEKNNYVNKDFKQKIFEREDISSSAFGNIAMPHPLEMCSKTSAIAVSIHKKAFMWKQTHVNIVFMLAIEETDRVLFKDIFDFLTDIIADDKKLNTLIHVKDYQEFITKIASYSN